MRHALGLLAQYEDQIRKGHVAARTLIRHLGGEGNVVFLTVRNRKKTCVMLSFLLLQVWNLPLFALTAVPTGPSNSPDLCVPLQTLDSLQEPSRDTMSPGSA